ncbi:hypothetical protein L596_030810 [Steinernema carpocapsae]|uniref:Uncharacterized protein n=1 Tax=Steinernema carpocapsae TaxID=34508 RepID=A0A4V6XVJ6_STECR|nr:hypothetical protein L596_030810 [Steinernema carpocapsae]
MNNESDEDVGNFSFMIPYALITNLNGTIDQYRSLSFENVFETYPWLFWALVVALATVALALLVATICWLSKNKKKVIRRGSTDVADLYGDGLNEMELAGRKALKCLAKKMRKSGCCSKSRTRRQARDVPPIEETVSEKEEAYRFPDDQQLHYAVPPQAVNINTADLKFDHFGGEVTHIVGVPVTRVGPLERRPLPDIAIDDDEFENVNL